MGNDFCDFPYMRNPLKFLYLILLCACTESQNTAPAVKLTTGKDATAAKPSVPYTDTATALSVNTGDITPLELVEYSKTLIGIPYKYASTNPQQGFDCSGFITYVFNHFYIDVPRSSVDFTNVPHEIPVSKAKPGDLILFTGTDSAIRTVGHMGIVVYGNNNELLFIHSTSGKANGVTITPLNDYYKGRFVKVIRVFRQNDSE